MGVRRRLNMWKSVLKCDGPPVENGIFVHIFSILYKHFRAIYDWLCSPYESCLYIRMCSFTDVEHNVCLLCWLFVIFLKYIYINYFS